MIQQFFLPPITTQDVTSKSLPLASNDTGAYPIKLHQYLHACYILFPVSMEVTPVLKNSDLQLNSVVFWLCVPLAPSCQIVIQILEVQGLVRGVEICKPHVPSHRLISTTSALCILHSILFSIKSVSLYFHSLGNRLFFFVFVMMLTLVCAAILKNSPWTLLDQELWWNDTVTTSINQVTFNYPHAPTSSFCRLFGTQ